jgi:hypothetical protein
MPETEPSAHDDPQRSAILGEATFLEKKALAGYKAHRKEADYWRRMNYMLVSSAGILAAVAGGTGLADLLDRRLAGAIALMAAAASAAAAGIGAPNRVAQHQTAATDFYRLAYSLREFCENAGRYSPRQEVLANFAKLTKRWDEVIASLVAVPLPAHRHELEWSIRSDQPGRGE